MSTITVITGLVVLLVTCNGSPLPEPPTSSTTENEIGVSDLISEETAEKPRRPSGSGFRERAQPTLKPVNREVVSSGTTPNRATTHLNPHVPEQATHKDSVVGHTTHKGSVQEHTTHKGSVQEHTTHKDSVQEHTTHTGSVVEHTTHKGSVPEHKAQWTSTATNRPTQKFKVKSHKRCSKHEKDHIVRIHVGTGRYLNINLSE